MAERVILMLVAELENTGRTPDPHLGLRDAQLRHRAESLGYSLVELRPRDEFDDLAARLRERAARQLRKEEGGRR